MRSTTVLSFLVAILLAGLAVYSARVWINSEREGIVAEALKGTRANGADTRTLVVANELLSFGERVSADKLREIEWASDVKPKGSFEKIDDVVMGDTDENARFAVSTIEEGEAILVTRITGPGQRAKLSTSLAPGMKAISIRVNDVLGVAGFVLPGDRVDVMLTRGDRNDEDAYVDVLLQGLKVLAIDQSSDERKDQPSVVRTVTFEVNTEEAQKLVLGANIGTLSLALRNFSSSEYESINRITLQDLGEIDISETLVPEEETVSEELKRLGSLEELMKSLSEGLTDRMEGVEESIQNREPLVVEKQVVVEKLIEIKQVPEKKAIVGVIRNGEREEYKVGPYGGDSTAVPSAVTGTE